MDETKARALAAYPYGKPGEGEPSEITETRDALAKRILAFAAEIRRDERERAAAICDGHAKESEQERLAARDQNVRACALWSRQSHEYDAKTIRALSDAPGATSKCSRCGQTVTNCRGCRDIRCPYSSVAAALALAEAGPDPTVAERRWIITQNDMDRLHGAAHGGALLGGEAAYDACLRMEGILAEIAARAALQRAEAP